MKSFRRPDEFAGDHPDTVADKEHSAILINETQVAPGVTGSGDDA